MKLQFLPAHEGLVALAAAKYLLFFVHVPDMHLQNGLTIEHSLTDQALEAVLARMVEPMGAQVTALDEGLLTEFAGERSLCSVRVEVPVQRALQRKARIALRAPVGPLVRVHTPMLDQRAVRRKAHLAMFAFVRPLVRVHSFVDLQQ